METAAASEEVSSSVSESNHPHHRNSKVSLSICDVYVSIFFPFFFFFFSLLDVQFLCSVKTVLCRLKIIHIFLLK